MKNTYDKIGIFDSGLGGLTILKEMVKLIPNREYLYLGDNLRAPYGDRSEEDIFRYTLAGVAWLFDNGAQLVILACNTASANALRKIQQEFLPLKHKDRRVLGIIIPTMEEVSGFSASGHIGLLATRATVISRVFEKEMKKNNLELQIACQSGGRLVELIEGNENGNILSAEIENVVGQLTSKDGLIDAIILGCTHYVLIKDQIRKILPRNISIIEQGDIVARKLADYIDRHEEFRKKLSNQPAVSFHTTSNSDEVKKMMAKFYGMNISVSTVAYEVK